jgi:PIN domain nuclease of toxin-antitoxin system
VLLRQHDELCRQLAAEQLPVTSRHAITAGGLSWQHPDPFDRALAAQAIEAGATLVTRDAASSELAGLATLW